MDRLQQVDFHALFVEVDLVVFQRQIVDAGANQ